RQGASCRWKARSAIRTVTSMRDSFSNGRSWPGWRYVGGIVSLIARFQVDSFEPRQVAGLDAEWLGVMTFAKTFTSGIIGGATTLFLFARTGEGGRGGWGTAGGSG